MASLLLGDRRHGFSRRQSLLAAIAGLSLFGAGMAHTQLKPIKRVLVISELGLSAPAIVMMLQEIRSSLERESAYHVEIYSEYLETSLFPESTLQQHFQDGYLRKYKDRKPDVVVAVGPTPITFLMKFGDQFVPDVPIVFCGSSREQAGTPVLGRQFTGAWLRFKPEKTLDAALRLLPETKRVFVVGGASPFDRGIEELTRRALKAYESRVEIEYLTDIEMPTLLNYVGHLPKESFVFWTSVMTDSAGRHFINAKESAPMVAAASNAPVFGMADMLVGSGIVGGYVSSYAAQARVAAQMIERILEGARPEVIPIIDGTSVYMFDSNALRRWGLKEKSLPAGSTVLFRKPTIWNAYPKQLTAIAIALLILTCLSIYLLSEQRRRRVAEQSLQANLLFERLISELTSHFVNLPADTIDTGIKRGLENLRSFFKVDRISVLEFSVDGRELLRTHTSWEMPRTPAIYRFQLEDYPWFTSALLRREKLLIDDLEIVADLTAFEKGYFSSSDIRSIASVPLVSGSTLLGALVLIMVQDKVVWPKTLLDQLTTVGQIFANALTRKQADDALVSSEMLKGAILSALSSNVTVLSESGEVILTNSHGAKSADPLVQDGCLQSGTNYLEICRHAGDNGDKAARLASLGMDSIRAGVQERFEFEWPYDSSAVSKCSLMTVTRLSNHANGLVVSFIDITARKEAEEERLELSGRLIRAQEDERSRLARELHDDFNQRLAVLAIDLERTAAVVQDRPEEAAHRMHSLWKRVSEIGTDLHSLSHRLHSSTLESLGLVLGLSSLCTDFTAQQDIQVDFAHKDVPKNIPPDVGLCIFRVVQEGLRNVKRHSGAKRAEVRLEGTSEELHLTLMDEGFGFDTLAPQPKAGLGLRSMRERLRLLDGHVEIRSHPAQGTIIEVVVPLEIPVATRDVDVSVDAQLLEVKRNGISHR